MIMCKHFCPAALVVMQVLDDERVIEIDDGWDRAGVGEEIVRCMPLDHRNICIAALLQEAFRSQRRCQQRHRVAIRLQDSFHFQKPDPDAGRLPVAEWLRTDEEHSTHARPFIRSTIVCSFHVRDLKIVSSSSCSLATSANSAALVCCDSACANWRSFKRTPFSCRSASAAASELRISAFAPSRWLMRISASLTRLCRL